MLHSGFLQLTNDTRIMTPHYPFLQGVLVLNVSVASSHCLWLPTFKFFFGLIFVVPYLPVNRVYDRGQEFFAVVLLGFLPPPPPPPRQLGQATKAPTPPFNLSLSTFVWEVYARLH
jgi:hypothetical protein